MQKFEIIPAKAMPEVPYRELGSGIPRIMESCEKAGVKVDFINQKEGSGQFKVVFWRKAANAD